MLKVSVVVTCYNLQDYIAEAIRSALDQTYEGPIEIIVVDDCSTDSSREIIAGFEGVHLISMPSNSGVLLATLRGIEAARGDILFFLDGDDVWHPDKLQQCMARFGSEPDLSMLTHDLRFVDRLGKPLDQGSRSAVEWSKRSGSGDCAFVRDAILFMRDYIWLGSAYGVRRAGAGLDEFIQWALALPDPRNTYQDWPLAYWIARRPELSLGYIPAKLFDYRIHGQNHSGGVSTPDRALRNRRRALNTSAALLQLAAGGTNAGRAIARRAAYDALMASLYDPSRPTAVSSFLRLVPWLMQRGWLARETLRFAAIRMLGCDRFLMMQAKFAGRQTRDGS